ncbi:MAG: class I SAM-dependent DNA methyltransferase [Actinomycetota bacterium]
MTYSDDVPSYHDLAGWYDAINEAAGKDYAAEAGAVLEVIAELRGAGPTSLLDAACGTGRHLEAFAGEVDDVAGLDVSPEMLSIASGRLGADVPLHEADLRDFDLGRTFDAVVCLFSSIGHVADGDELDRAVTALARHVAPGGVLVIEPWLTPDRVRPGGMRSLDSAETDEGVVARAATSREVGGVLLVEFGWAVATTGGVATLEERHHLPLFTRERYLASVEAAGLVASWRDDVTALRTGRGLLLGRRTDGTQGGSG